LAIGHHDMAQFATDIALSDQIAPIGAILLQNSLGRVEAR